jgi:tetratricopeptide (TPR) repeat protein
VPSPFVRRGYFRYWKKDFAGAVDDFTKAIEWKADYAVAYAERAFAHGLLGNIDAALADVQQAVALNPESITLHTPASPFSVPFGSVNVFIKSHPTNARAYEVRGVFNLLQDKRDDAMTDFNQAVALQPSLKSEIDRIIARLRN